MARRISSPLLVGRANEMRAFEEARSRIGSDATSILVLGGDAGSGKTRLIQDFAARIQAEGGLALVGSSPPTATEPAIPYASVTQVLRSLVRRLDARTVEDVLGRGRADVAMLVPEVGAAPARSDSSNPFAQTRLFESILSAIERVAVRHAPLFVAFEDLHWADASSRSLVSYLARNLSTPCVLALTYRADAIGVDTALASTIAELDRLPEVERFELGTLVPDEVRSQLAAIMGRDPTPDELNVIVRRSNGNPFFVEELAIAALEGEPERLPPSVRLGVEARVARLPDQARAVVRAAAVSGPNTPPPLLAQMLGRDLAEVRQGVQDCVREHLLETSTQETDGLDFRHVLVREAVTASINSSDRLAFHRAAADALEAVPALGTMSGLERATRIASHLVAAGDSARGLPALARAAAEAERAHAFAEADAAYGQVLAGWNAAAASAQDRDPSFDEDRREAVLERAAEVASLVGDPGRAVTLIESAISARQPEVGDDHERQARLLTRRARFLWEAGRGDAAIKSQQAALTQMPAGSSALRLRATVSLARLLMLSGRYGESIPQAEAAAALAESAGDRREQAHALTTLGVDLAMTGELEQALGALARGRRHDAVRGRSSSRSRAQVSRLPDELRDYVDRAVVLQRAGSLLDAASVALEGAEDAKRLGLSSTWGELLTATAALDLFRLGRWDEVAALIGAGASSGVTPERRIVRALLATARGRFVDAEADLIALGDRPVFVAHGVRWAALPAAAQAELAYWRHRLVDARSAVQKGMTIAGELGDDESLVELATLGLRIEAEQGMNARARRSLGQWAAAEETAATLLAQLRASDNSASSGGAPSARSESLRSLGELEHRRLTGVATPDDWSRGVNIWDDLGDAYTAAYARWRQAETILGAGGRRTDAEAPLREAAQAASRLGANPLFGQIEDLARRARLELGPPVEREAKLAESGSAIQNELRRLGLSVREVEVLALVEEGLTDRDIGLRLFITEKSAGHHVSHILAKLGVSRRVEAAAIAHRLNLAGAGVPAEETGTRTAGSS